VNVTVLNKTSCPEKLVCRAARGDYSEEFVGSTGYRALMRDVSHDDYHEQRVKELIEPQNVVEGEWPRYQAKTLAFIEKQLSRGHYGPWEHPQITFAVEGVSRVTMAQITRHRLMSFDVQSQRYVDFSETSAVVPATLLSDKRRHEEYPHVYDSEGSHFNRDEGHFEMNERTRSHWRNAYKAITADALEFYQDAVEAGIPKEDARFVLPVGTPVNMTFSGNARTFLHLLDMRRKLNAQWEIRELSERLLEELSDWMPFTFTYYQENGPNRLGP